MPFPLGGTVLAHGHQAGEPPATTWYRAKIPRRRPLAIFQTDSKTMEKTAGSHAGIAGLFRRCRRFESGGASPQSSTRQPA
jgi:hypothetical protein